MTSGPAFAFAAFIASRNVHSVASHDSVARIVKRIDNKGQAAAELESAWDWASELALE